MKRGFIFLVFLIVIGCDIPGRNEYNDGVAAWNKEDYPAAIEKFESAIQKNPEMGEAYQGVAESLARKQKLAEAKDYYQKAQDLYNAGKFQDTPISNDKKKERVKEQLDWIEDVLEMDSKRAASTSVPASAPASQPQ